MEYSKEHDAAMTRSNLYGALAVTTMFFGAIFAAVGFRLMVDTGLALPAVLGPAAMVFIGVALLAVWLWANARCEKIYQDEVRPLRVRDMGNWARENVSWETRQFVAESLMGVPHAPSDRPIVGGDIITTGGHHVEI